MLGDAEVGQRVARGELMLAITLDGIAMMDGTPGTYRKVSLADTRRSLGNMATMLKRDPAELEAYAAGTMAIYITEGGVDWKAAPIPINPLAMGELPGG
jgi:hypothetical protein